MRIGERSGMGLSNLYGVWEKEKFVEPSIRQIHVPANRVAACKITDGFVAQPTVFGNDTYTLNRSFDAYGHMIRNDGADFTFAADGQLAAISNAIASVEYFYTADRLDAGYTVALPNGVSFRPALAFLSMRRNFW